MLNLHFLVARACRFTRSPGPPTAGESKAERDTPGGGDPSAGCHLDQGDHHPVFRTDSGPDYGAEKRSSGHAYSNGDDVTEPNKGVVAASRALLGRDNSSGSAESEESDKGATASPTASAFLTFKCYDPRNGDGDGVALAYNDEALIAAILVRSAETLFRRIGGSDPYTVTEA